MPTWTTCIARTMNITPVIFIVMQLCYARPSLPVWLHYTLSHSRHRDSLADWASENEMKIHFLTHLPGMKINLTTSTVQYLVLL